MSCKCKDATGLWPCAKTIAAAVRGDLRVVRAIEGVNIRCVGSAFAWVLYLPGEGVACTRCNTSDAEPNPPASTPPGAKRKPLLEPGGEQHATFLLTWLNAFARKHGECAE